MSSTTNQVYRPVPAEMLTRRGPGVERRRINGGYELCSQSFPDGRRTLKYLLADDGAIRIPIQYSFCSHDGREEVWRYHTDSASWFRLEDSARENPWRAQLSFDRSGRFCIIDGRTLRFLDSDGSEYRSRVDDNGVEAVLKLERQSKRMYARNGADEWTSNDGDLWESNGASAKRDRMRFSLNLNGDFIIEIPHVRVVIHHSDGSRTVRLPNLSYVERDGVTKIFDASGHEEGDFVPLEQVDELPDSNEWIKSRVINHSTRPILVGARGNNERDFKIYVVEALTSTPFSNSPCFVVDDPRFQCRVVDGRTLVPTRIPTVATVFKLGCQKLKITNESWGFVLIGWPVAGQSTIGGIVGEAALVAIRPTGKRSPRNRTVAIPDLFGSAK